MVENTEQVTVLCACEQPLYFGQRECASCGADVPTDLRDELERRVEASDADYRACKEQFRRGVAVLLMLGGIQLTIALLLWLGSRIGESYPSTAERVAPALLSMAAWAAGGIVLLGCAWATRRYPVGAFALALIVMLVLWIGPLVASPRLLLLSFLSAAGVASLFFKLVGLLLLVRATWVAREFRSLRAALERG